MEVVLNTILEAMRDRDTDIRWAGAKGIGRIVSRLPKHLANDVLSNIIKFNFNLHSGNAAWHGGCLAVAELARRGFLPLERLQDIVKILLNVSHLLINSLVRISYHSCILPQLGISI